MLNPMYVRLVQEQKEHDFEAVVKMNQRCLEGYSCQVSSGSWYTRLLKYFARPRSQQVVSEPCKVC